MVLKPRKTIPPYFEISKIDVSLVNIYRVPTVSQVLCWEMKLRKLNEM